MEELRQWSMGWFSRIMSSDELALAPTDLSFGWVTSWWMLVPLVDDSAEIESVCFSCGPSNPCDACMATSDWLALFSLDQRGVFLLCFQLNSSIHNFLQGHMECRGFISSMCTRNASSFLFVVLTLIFGP
jgi:hypothetical protein